MNKAPKIYTKQSRLTGAISLSIAQAVVLFLGYATHLIIGRVLGPGSYGIYGIVLSIQTIVGLFLTLGVPMAVSRFVAQNTSQAQSILRLSLRIQALVALGLASATLLLAPVISRLLGDTSLTGFISFVAAVLFFQALYPIFAQFLSGMHRFSTQAALTAFYAVAKLIGAVALIFVWQVYGALAGFAIGGMVAAIIGWYWTRNIGGRKQQRLSYTSFLSFAGMYVLILAGLQVLISLDLFMVKAILGDNVQAGYYNAAVTISRIPYFLLQGLAFIILPSVSTLTKPGAPHEQAATFIRDTLRYLIILIIPGIALAATTSKRLIILFFSSDYIPAAAPLTILMIGLGALSFFLLLINIVAGAGKAKVGLIITIILVIGSAMLGSILIPRFGLIGAAWQTTSVGLVGLSVLAMYTFRTFHIPVPVKSTLNVLIASAVAVAPTYAWETRPLLLPVQYLLLGILYIFVLILLGEATASDRQRAAHVIERLRALGQKV